MTTPNGGNAGTKPVGGAGTGPGRLLAALRAEMNPSDLDAAQRVAAAAPPLNADQRAVLLALLKPAATRRAA